MRKLALFGLVIFAAGIAAPTALADGSAPQFTFGSDEPGTTFKCSIDGGAATSCTSPQSYSNLSPGPHTVVVTASFTVPAAAPANTALPVISGTTQHGSTLSTTNGTWNGSPTFTYQWQDCSGSSCTKITGATGSTYKLQASDVGDKVSVVVTGTNAGGSAKASANPVGPVTAPASTGMLVGNQTVQSTADNNAAGNPQAWSYTASASGTANSVSLYVDSGNAASSVTLGLYSDASGKPGSLLDSATVTSPNAGAWNSANLTGNVQLTQGTKYWLAVLGAGGTPYFRDTGATGSCTTVTASTTGSTLPQSFKVGGTWQGFCPASFHVDGSPVAPAPPPSTTTTAPSNMAKPTVSGTAQQGSQLTASTGTWSGTTPMTYAYQWQNCSSSCSNISGATSSSYTPTASDMGDTLDVKVMASNGAGNASATSNQTASVTAPSGGGGSGSCDLNATPSNFTAQVAAATSGQTICLGAGNYAEWDGGTTKTLTITAAPGASPNFCFDLYNTSNLTIDGGHTNYDITTAGINSDCGDGIESSSSNITIKNVSLSCDGANNFCIDDRSENSGINITKNIFHDMQYPNNASAGVFVNKSNNDPTSTHIDYNLFENMGADGIDPGNGVTMIGNDFNNVNSDSTDPRHTDVIQFAEDDVIEGNFVHDGCIQGIDAFDGAANNTITDNVIVSCSVHSLVTAADTPGSLVAHNTVIGAGGLECGSKTGSPPSTTQVRDNILQEGINWGGVKCTPSVDQDNMSWPSFGQISSSSDFIGTPQFTGGSNPSTYAGYALAAGSPGKSKASDGGDVGARVNLYPRPAGLA